MKHFLPSFVPRFNASLSPRHSAGEGVAAHPPPRQAPPAVPLLPRQLRGLEDGQPQQRGHIGQEERQHRARHRLRLDASLGRRPVSRRAGIKIWHVFVHLNVVVGLFLFFSAMILFLCASKCFSLFFIF